MTVQDYPVSFGYKAQDGQFYGAQGSIGLYHLGEDLYTPTGTRFELKGKLLGLTGATGNVGGPHIHLAKWKSGNQAGGYYVSKYNRTYFKATPSIWQSSGKVSEISTQNVGDAGKFVRWQADDGYTYEGFHLSQVNVTVGERIGDTMIPKITKEQENVMSFLATGGYPGTGYDYRFVGQPLSNEWVNFWLDVSKKNGLIKNSTAGFKPITKQLYERI